MSRDQGLRVDRDQGRQVVVSCCPATAAFTAAAKAQPTRVGMKNRWGVVYRVS